MRRYLKLFFTFISNNLVRSMEYRSDFLISMILNIFWVLLHIWVILTIFQYTNNIFGWTKNETIVLYGIVRITKGFFDMFIRKNIFSFPESISAGDLDYTLTKPVNTLFLTSFRFHAFAEISTLISGFFILAYSLIVVNFEWNIFTISILLISCTVSLLAYYSLLMFFVTFSFFTTRFSAIGELHDLVSQTMRYPSDIFSKSNLTAEILILPISMIATYPASVILGKTNSFGLLIEILIASIMFALMYSFWNFALRRYSSASS